MRFHRPTGTLLTLTAVTGMVTALATTPGAAFATAPSGGARQQAIVSLAGSTEVTAPGVRVTAVLAGVHAEIVDATAAGLAALAATPGVTGVSPNSRAQLQSDGWSDPQSSATPDLTPAPSPSPSATPSTDPTPTPAPAPGDVGVSAAQSVGGIAGTPGAGSGVTIALIDTGVSDTAALNRASGRLVDAVDTSGLNTPKGKVVDSGTFTDGFGHGTFMASLIAGATHSGTATLGVGVAPGATIDIVKVADDQGNTSLAAVLAGLNWVATHADTIDIANLSLSVDRPSGSYGVDPLNFAVTITRALGVTVVVAAGNTPGQVGDPGFAPAALTVGAADTTGSVPVVADFSGSANVDGVNKPDVVAAGVEVLGEMPTDSVIGQEYPAGRQPSGLFRGSGTSQSTAIVSGIAALFVQAHPKASPQQVKASIRGAATGIVPGPTDGTGLVSVPTVVASAANLGESGLNVLKYALTALQWGNVFLSPTFDVRRWAARRWAGDGWDARRWANNEWAGVSFDARRWANADWASGQWDARRWAASSWDGTT